MSFSVVALFLVPVFAAAQAPVDSSRAKSDSATVIAPVVVSAAPSELDAVGFLERRRRGAGRFLDRSDIERRQPRTVSSIFRNIPGFRTVITGARSRVQGTRGGGGCMTYFIDNAPYRPVLGTDIDDALPVSEVAAIEIYTVASTPAEYTMGDRGLCSTVVIWTRARIDDRRRQSGRAP